MIVRRTGLKRYTPPRQVSKKQYRRIGKYSKVKKKFLEEHDVCARCGKPAVQVHHGKGKTGDMLYDIDFFIPLCEGECHDYLEAHPDEAKKIGLSFKRNI